MHFVMGGRVKGGLIGEAPEVRNMFPHIGGPMPVIDTRRLWTTVARQWLDVDTSNLFSKRHESLGIYRLAERHSGRFAARSRRETMGPEARGGEP